MTGLKGDAYGILRKAYSVVPHDLFWNRLGYVDTVSHSHRIHVPVMLSGGGQDTVCPPATVEYLYQHLQGISKQYTYLKDNVHTHSRQSMTLIRSWLALHA